MCDLVGYNSSDNEEDPRPSEAAETRGTAASILSCGDSPRESLTTSQSIGPVLLPYQRSSDHTSGLPFESTPTNCEREAPASKADILQNTLVGPQALPIDGLNRDGSTGQLSTYSERRATIRNLTLPTIFDLEIPPSPPGSPSPEISQKFEHFMQLKKQGLHFNEKLGGSSALKNPLLLHKLMSSAGLREADQYATTLPKCLWNPTAFPAWAYDEALIRSRQDLMSRKEDENTREQRDRVDFIPATN